MSQPKKPGANVADPLDQTRGDWNSSYLTFLLDDQSGWSHSVYAEAYYYAARTLTRSLRRGRWAGHDAMLGSSPFFSSGGTTSRSR